MNRHYAIAEQVAHGKSQSMRFFAPTRWKWQSQLKVLTYRAWHAFSKVEIESRIVGAERAEYLLVSYTEWVLRCQIDNATLSHNPAVVI